MTILHYWPSQIGKGKVFLRAGQMALLDARRAEVLGKAARSIQRQIRTYIARKEFIRLREAAIHLQSCCRGMEFTLKFILMLNCVIGLEAHTFTYS